MPSAPTRIILLGRIAIERGDAAPTTGLAGRRAEIVFAYLAVEHRRSVSRDELAGALWPDLLPDTWNAALRGVLSDVRRFLERAGLNPAETLLTEQGRLRLRLPVGTSLDVDEAQDALAQARALLVSGDAARAGHTAGLAADAAALPFLSFHDEGWASEVQERLDRLHIDALELQGRAFAAAGDPRAAIAAADRLIRADPYLEAAHRLRITMLGAAGDRAGALKAYERCKTLLSTELGIAPSPETEDALRAALAGAPAAATPASPEVSAAPDAAPTEPPRPASTTSAAAASPFADYSILVVEDHDFQRRTTLTLLRGLGVRDLRDAADGAAALERLDEAAAPDVIICDIDMPGMDGVEFIRNVAERRLASAVVIASGLDDRVLQTVRAASEGYGLQVLGAVGKPLTVVALEGLLAGYRPPRRSAVAEADPTGAVASLAAALADGSLAVHFEPIIDLAVGRVAGLRPVVHGGAADLAAAADAAGLGRAFVEHLLRATGAIAESTALTAFVELTPSVLTDVALADALAAIASDDVVLVVGAAALGAQSSPAMLDLLARLRVKGYGLCVDGFDGPALERLPLTHVQLAADSILAAARSGDASGLQPAIEAGRLLGVPILGRCTTSEEFDLLLQVGCSFAHGPFLAAAVPAEAFGAAARDWTAPEVVDHSR